MLLSALLILVDQITKYTVRHWGGFYICNEGIAFGINISNHLFWFIWLIILMSLFIPLILKLKFQISNQYQTKKTEKFDTWILDFIWHLKFVICNFKLDFVGPVFILSGAISNIIDRFYFGCVVDFIDLKFWPIFNLADIFIVFGAIILILQIKKQK